MRRLFALGAVIVLLLAILIAGNSALGTRASDDATPAARMLHPLVGSWILDVGIQDPDNPPSLVIFSAEGSYLESHPVAGTVAIGTWEATGAASAALTFHFVDVSGIGTNQSSIEVAPDGQTFTVLYTIEFVGFDGASSGKLGPGTVMGSRIMVEPVGTPVASFADFSEPAATPEGESLLSFSRWSSRDDAVSG